jgi:hypothetical protein
MIKGDIFSLTVIIGQVTVEPPSNASRVVCSGDGLRSGTMGKEIKCHIDTRLERPSFYRHCTAPAAGIYSSGSNTKANPNLESQMIIM